VAMVEFKAPLPRDMEPRCTVKGEGGTAPTARPPAALTAPQDADKVGMILACKDLAGTADANLRQFCMLNPAGSSAYYDADCVAKNPKGLRLYDADCVAKRQKTKALCRVITPETLAYDAAHRAAGAAETKDIEIRPSFLVSALFFATGLEPPLEARSSDAPIKARDSIWRTDPKDPCVLIQEAINPTTIFSLPTDCVAETCSRRPANPPTARLVRYDFSLFPSASDADFRQYRDVVTLHLPPDAFCLARQEQDGTVHPLPGQTCIGTFVMWPGAATRKLQALAYIQREFCPATAPRKPQLIQPY
jgi:hypothetical protein